MQLPLRGRVVSEVAWSLGGLWLRFWGQRVAGSASGPDYALHIEGSFRLVGPRETIEGDPQTPEAWWFGLVERRVSEADADDSGALVLSFDDGDRLEIPPGALEAWQLEGEDGDLVVSVAGGGLAAWDAG